MSGAVRDWQDWQHWQDWAPDALTTVAVLVLGAYEVSAVVDGPQAGSWVVVGGFAVAAGLSRHLPGLALALVWLTGAYQLSSGAPILLTELTVVLVAFGTARWGSAITVVLSGLSIPGAALVVTSFASGDSLALFLDIEQAERLLDTAYRFGDTWRAGAAIIGTAALGAPWLAGLSLRFMARAQRSQLSEETAQADAARAQRETAQAQEIAQLRAEQARLARDVHDVVGHSLAVILAQAESAQYLADDPEKLKSTMATIATSARSSLQDVRQVLATTDSAPARPGGLEALVEGVRATGQEVLVDEVGPPRPLPPELEVVAHRVVQEMLTNAVRHGRRDRPIHVERHWPQDTYERDLRIEVSNSTTAPPAADETQPMNAVATALDDPGGGQGLAGMRRRVESVGGRLDVRRRTGPDGPTFTATAWVPVRA